MWLHPDLDQALSFAVRLCAIGQLVGLLELMLVRSELSDSGFLDWTMIGNLSPRARTRAGGAVRRAFRRLPRRAFAGILIADAGAAAALLVWPASPLLIALAVALQVAILKRHHLTIDGSDQMMLVVLVACLLGRLGGGVISARAAVSFLAAELALAYAVAGFAKATSSHWRSGRAFTVIAQTRMYGQPLVASLVRRHPGVGRAASYSVVAWESLAFLTLTAPGPIVYALLVAGIGFHVGCAAVMGLNRFLWGFVAGYPAILCTNAAIRGQLGAATANRVTLAAAVIATGGMLCAAGMPHLGNLRLSRSA
jgi:hypothetical protein